MPSEKIVSWNPSLVVNLWYATHILTLNQNFNCRNSSFARYINALAITIAYLTWLSTFTSPFRSLDLNPTIKLWEQLLHLIDKSPRAILIIASS